MTDQDLHTILATDCGSTTTKAILIEKRDDTWQLEERANYLNEGVADCASRCLISRSFCGGNEIKPVDMGRF